MIRKTVRKEDTGIQWGFISFVPLVYVFNIN